MRPSAGETRASGSGSIVRAPSTSRRVKNWSKVRKPSSGIATSLTTEQLASVSDPADLARARTGTVINSASAEYLATRDVSPRGYRDLPAALAALREGELDAVVYDVALLAWHLEQAPDSGLRLLPHTLTRQEYAFALPAGSTLREPLNREILRHVATPGWRESVKGY